MSLLRLVSDRLSGGHFKYLTAAVVPALFAHVVAAVGCPAVIAFRQYHIFDFVVCSALVFAGF
jgi:hypothetical protein